MGVYIFFGIVIIGILVGWGIKVWKEAHTIKVHRGDFRKLRIIVDNNRFSVERTDGVLFGEWEEINYYETLAEAKSSLAKTALEYEKRRNKIMAQREADKEKAIAMKKELDEIEQLSAGMAIKDVRTILAEEYV